MPSHARAHVAATSNKEMNIHFVDMTHNQLRCRAFNNWSVLKSLLLLVNFEVLTVVYARTPTHDASFVQPEVMEKLSDGETVPRIKDVISHKSLHFLGEEIV